MQPERVCCAKLLKSKVKIEAKNLKSPCRRRGRVRYMATGAWCDSLVFAHTSTLLRVQRFLAARTCVLNCPYVKAQS